MRKNYNSLQEFSDALNRSLLGLNDHVAKISPIVSKRFVGRIRDRVVRTGISGDSSAFSSYTEKHKAKKTKSGRAPFGKTTSFKNFYYQGTMWDNFKHLSTTNSPGMVKVGIGFSGNNVYMSNAELHEVHSWQGASRSRHKEGKNISAPSVQDEKDLTEWITEHIYTYLVNTL